MLPSIAETAIETVFGPLVPHGIRLHHLAVTQDRMNLKGRITSGGYRFAFRVRLPADRKVANHLTMLGSILESTLRACGLKVAGVYVDGILYDPLEGY